MRPAGKCSLATGGVRGIIASMPQHVIIDGNNLLYAMHAQAPMPHVGRETLVKLVERWAGRGDHEVTLVFDGPIPPGGLARQMASDRITVRFSAPVTADDIIVDMIHQAKDPTIIRVVTSDNAIRHEAKRRRSRNTVAADFIEELFPQDSQPRPPGSGAAPAGEPVCWSNRCDPPLVDNPCHTSLPNGRGSEATSPPTPNEKPDEPSAKEAKEWLETFEVSDDEPEPFDGYDAMRP